jgi:CRISPR-associated protein Cmr4
MINARLYFVMTRSPLHMGAGESLGAIDQPIKRHVVTNHPQIVESGIKGCLKSASKTLWKLSNDQHRALFGGEPGNHLQDQMGDSENRGSASLLSPQDAMLLLLPVACWAGGWAWATSPSVLLRFQRLAGGCNLEAACRKALPQAVPRPPDIITALCVQPETASPLVSLVGGAHFLTLLDEALNAKPDAKVALWASWFRQYVIDAEPKEWADDFERRVVVVPDACFDRLAHAGMDIRARNRIGDDGLAQDTGLWREECVPEDAIFAGVICAQRVPKHEAIFTEQSALRAIKPCTLQIGGKAGVGYGWVDFRPAAMELEHPTK